MYLPSIVGFLKLKNNGFMISLKNYEIDPSVSRICHLLSLLLILKVTPITKTPKKNKTLQSKKAS